MQQSWTQRENLVKNDEKVGKNRGKTRPYLGALNNPGQIEQLDLGALVYDHAWHRCQCREFVRRHLKRANGEKKEEEEKKGGKGGW